MIRVVKLGGSLLELPDLSSRVHRWLATEPPAFNVFVIGGGPVVDGLRALHNTSPIADDTAHWLCIRAMSLTAQYVAAWCGWPLVETWHELSNRHAGEISGGTPTRSTCIFVVENWLHALEPSQPGIALPIGWQVTSDSIAARLAETLRADELVLLKSCSPPDNSDWQRFANENIVDPWFPTAVAHLNARIHNLREGYPSS